MSTSIRMMILCATLIFTAIQVQAFPNSAAPAAEATPASVTTYKGTVAETMNVSGYTYLHLENDGQNYWAAVPAAEVKVGDKVELAAGMEMHNFQSKSLGRTFDTIIFARGLVTR